jgi:hypothetical protein
MEMSGQDSRPGRFTPRKGVPDTHWIGGWVGPRADLDAVVKRKIPSPCRDSNPRSSSSRSTKLWRGIGGLKVWLHVFLTSALDGGVWSASRPGSFTAREKAPGTHWIGGWVGPRAVVDTVVRRKIPSPCRDSNPRSSSPVSTMLRRHIGEWRHSSTHWIRH